MPAVVQERVSVCECVARKSKMWRASRTCVVKWNQRDTYARSANEISLLKSAFTGNGEVSESQCRESGEKREYME